MNHNDKRKITIAYKITNFNLYGGVENYLKNLLNSLDLNKFEIHLIHTENNPLFMNLFKKDIFFHKLPKLSSNLFKHLSAEYKLYKKYKFDIIHSHINEFNAISVLLGFLANIKVRISHSHNSKFARPILALFLKPIISLFSTHYFACSESASHALHGSNTDYYFAKLGVRLDAFKFDSSKRKIFRNKYSINEKTLLLGSVGRLTKVKNHQFLIKLINLFRYKNSNFKLILVGQGPMELLLKNSIEKFNLKNYVILIDKIDDLSFFYSAIDIFLLPSLYEGFPIVLIESQASGLPCIVSNKISNEVNFLNLINFLPLNNLSNWIETILLTKISNRENSILDYQNSPFLLKNTVSKIEEKYNEII